ncbi:MAG: general secretion pathway protein GspB [Deltaproteobacteria bacterium]|nr:general secretion pathway protein GspB [Deltaproteobacteria bacterium]
MSSILRALKKLERDTASGRAAVPELPVGSASGRQGQTARAFFLVLVILIVSGAGALYFISGPAHVPVTEASRRIEKQPSPAGVSQKPVVLAGKKPALLMKATENAAPAAQIPVKPAMNDLALNSPKTATGLKSAPIMVKKFPKYEPEPKEIGDAAGLKLQAISWSPSPARRMAVINNRICHEGEGVEGYVIKEITPDVVLMKKGENTGKLSFALRR